MASCRLRVPAAEARNAGSASSGTLLIPRPPLFVGSVACVQLLSVKVMLRIFSRPVLSSASYLARPWCPAHGAVRRVYSSLGAPREILRMRRGWCRDYYYYYFYFYYYYFCYSYYFSYYYYYYSY